MDESKINQFIHSSLTLAILSFTALSTAYCYAWGLAFYHGYPWWYVEIAQAGIVRAVAYVFGTFLVIFVTYLLGYALVYQIFEWRYFKKLGWLRVFVLVSMFSLPALLTFYLFIGSIPKSIALFYLIVTILCVMCFHKRWDHRVFHLDIRKMFNEERFWLVYLFIFVYFSLLAMCVGYVRSELRTTYDYLKIEGKPCYILSINRDRVYILGEKPRGNNEFIFFHQDTQQYYRIHISHIDD